MTALGESYAIRNQIRPANLIITGSTVDPHMTRIAVMVHPMRLLISLLIDSIPDERL
jgi:hypothetical protein